MSVVLFFSKVNLVSGEIFDVYKDETILQKILHIMAGDISSDSSYLREETYGKGDQIFTDAIEYKLNVIKKTDDYIEGFIYKKSRIFFNSFNEKTNELIRRTVQNTEAIRFYFDIYKETIGFHTTGRFGYQEFNNSMTGIINKCMQDNKRTYRFDVALRTEGLNLEEIKTQLRCIKNIKELKLKFQPPNPDTEALQELQKSGEEFINSMEIANVTGVSYIFTSHSAEGIDIDSPMINEDIDKIAGINSVLGDKKAVSRGYISVEAQGKNGKKYTTAEAKPVKTVIENMFDFASACVETIKTIL